METVENEKCVFCKIVSGKDEKTNILHSVSKFIFLGKNHCVRAYNFLIFYPVFNYTSMDVDMTSHTRNRFKRTNPQNRQFSLI